jgi:hypothetical protein
MWSSFWVDGINQFVLFAVIAVTAVLQTALNSKLMMTLNQAPSQSGFLFAAGKTSSSCQTV